MPNLLRNALALLAGFFLGGAVNMGLVLVGYRLVPPPPGVNPADAASIAASIHLFGPQHFLFPFLAHAGGTFVGALIAHLLAGSYRRTFAFVIGTLTLAGGIAASFMIPAPGWFIALDLLAAYLPMAWLATRVGCALRPLQTAAPTAPAS